MEQTANCFALRNELVVDPRSLGFVSVTWNGMPRVLRYSRVSRHVWRTSSHSARENDRSSPVLKEFLDVRYLDARYVMRSGLTQIQARPAAGPDLHVTPRLESFDFHFAPREMSDSR